MRTSLVLGLACTVSASLVARDTATILADLSNIDTNALDAEEECGADKPHRVNALGDSISSLTFQSGSDAITAVINAESALEDAIKTGTADTQATSPLDDEDAAQVLTAVKNIITDIVTTLNAAVAQWPVFQGSSIGDISGVVTSDLKSLQTETDALAAALTNIAPAQDDAAAAAAKSCIDAGFQSALATLFADDSCTTDIVIPGQTTSSAPGTTPTSTPGTTPTSTPGTTPSSSPGTTEKTPTNSGTQSLPSATSSWTNGSTTSSTCTTATTPSSPGNEYTTSTIYTTTTSTISSCASTVTNCPYNSVTTVVIPVSTTVCPISDQATPTSSSGSSSDSGSGSGSSSPSGGEGGVTTGGASAPYSAPAGLPTSVSQSSTVATPVNSGPAVVVTAAGAHNLANGFGAVVAVVAAAAMF